MRSLVPSEVRATRVSPSLTRSTVAMRVRGVAAWRAPRVEEGGAGPAQELAKVYAWNGKTNGSNTNHSLWQGRISAA
jgi:hypothetical protein